MSSVAMSPPTSTPPGAPPGGKMPPPQQGGQASGQPPGMGTLFGGLNNPDAVYENRPYVDRNQSRGLADLRQSDPSAYGIYMSQQGAQPAGGSPTFQIPGQQNPYGNDMIPGQPGGGVPTFGLPGGQTMTGPPGQGNGPSGSLFGGLNHPGAVYENRPNVNRNPTASSGMTVAPNDPFSQPTSAMDVYRSAVPAMKQDLTDRLSDSMAGAGFSGNRFGSYAMNTAAQEGAKTGLQQNQLMTSLLHNQTNTDLDRALQAANMGAQHGQAANQMQLDRMKFAADQGRYEQGRQDLFSRQSYEDFERNKMGWLPMLMQMAQSAGSPTQGVWGNQQSGGDPGFLDYATLIAQIYGAR